MIAAAGIASQALSALMSALSPSSGASTSQSTTTSCFQQAVPQPSSAVSTSSSVSPLSSDILKTLMAMQQQASSGAASSPAQSAQQLFSAMDSDDDGQVSQSEMESYIQKIGGTQAQADSLFTSLDQNGAAGISESQMAGAASSAQAQGGHHHHHHSGMGGGQQADNVASSLLQAMDTNDDGSVDQGEFSNFVTANGGSATNTANDFAALNTSGTGSLTSADFAKAWNAYQTQQSAQSSGSMAVSWLNAFAQSSGATSVTA